MGNSLLKVPDRFDVRFVFHVLQWVLVLAKGVEVFEKNLKIRRRTGRVCSHQAYVALFMGYKAFAPLVGRFGPERCSLEEGGRSGSFQSVLRLE